MLYWFETEVVYHAEIVGEPERKKRGKKDRKGKEGKKARKKKKKR